MFIIKVPDKYFKNYKSTTYQMQTLTNQQYNQTLTRRYPYMCRKKKQQNKKHLQRIYSLRFSYPLARTPTQQYNAHMSIYKNNSKQSLNFTKYNNVMRENVFVNPTNGKKVFIVFSKKKKVKIIQLINMCVGDSNQEYT